MKWLALTVTLLKALADIASLFRDRRLRREGREEAIRRGREAVDERARLAEAASAHARADPDLLRDDGHRRD